MAYQAMARRYRPATFDDVIGQEHVAQTLKNAITSDRVSHAYLFCGPHGVGKTSMARIFAKSLNCTGGPSVDIPEDCPICADINAGNDPDVQEIDGASNNSVDQVRTLREQAGYVPARAKYKIYIIDEVHMLSASAFNALLKTLEEPPAHVKFILATTEPHKLLETVLSRCQRFDFRLVPPQKVCDYLLTLCEKESVNVERDALEAIAAFSSGSMRDGLVLLDQLISYCPEKITREDVECVRGAAGMDAVISVYDSIAAHDSMAGLNIIEEVASRGTSIGDFLDQLIEYGRDLMLFTISKSVDKISSYGPAKDAVKRHAEKMPLEESLLILDVFTNARIKVRSRALSNPLVPLEMAVARLAGLEKLEPVGKVIERIEELAKSGALSGGLEYSGRDIKLSPSTENTSKKKLEVEPEQQAIAETVETKNYQETPPATVSTNNLKNYDSSEEEDENESSSEYDSYQPPAQGGDITLEYIESHWQDFLETVRKNYKPDIAYLHEVRPIAYANGKLTIELPAGGVFLMENIEDPRRHKRITEAFTSSMGREIKFYMKIADGEASSSTGGSPTAAGKSVSNTSSQVLSDPFIQKLMDKFKCELLNIE